MLGPSSPTDTFIWVNPLLCSVTERELIEVSVIFSIEIHVDPSTRCKLFEVSAPGYHLEAGLAGTSVYLSKNTKTVRAQFLEAPGSPEFQLFVLCWSDSMIGIVGAQGAIQQKTATVAPPHDLLRWARKKSVLPTPGFYENGGHVFAAVLEHLASVKAKLSSCDANLAFWDITYDGNRIVSRRPKHEEHIHRLFEVFFYDLDLTRNLEVSPEHKLGKGYLDFLVTGTLKDGSKTHVCVEVKKAHARDLAHGLEQQLVEYMRIKETNLGVYIVLDFGSEFPQVSRFSDARIPGLEHEPMDTQLYSKCLDLHPLLVKYMIFELFDHDPPSKL